jgi:hypothetical protein
MVDGAIGIGFFFFFNYLLELNGAPTFLIFSIYTRTTTFMTVASGKEGAESIKKIQGKIHRTKINTRTNIHYCR